MRLLLMILGNAKPPLRTAPRQYPDVLGIVSGLYKEGSSAPASRPTKVQHRRLVVSALGMNKWRHCYRVATDSARARRVQMTAVIAQKPRHNGT
jgi:hypothetical protein